MPTLRTKDFTITEGKDSAAIFTVESTEKITGSNAFRLLVQSGTAADQQDFDLSKLEYSDDNINFKPIANNSEVSIPIGKEQIYIKVPIADDNVMEPPELFTLTATPITGFDGGPVVETAIILDNNQPPVVLPTVVSVSNPTAIEGQREVFEVQLSSVTTASTAVVFDVNFVTATSADLTGGFEYSFDGNNWVTLSDDRVDVPAGKSSFQVRTNTAIDSLIEVDETFKLTAGANGREATGTATIQNLAAPVRPKVVSVSNPTATEGQLEIFEIRLSDVTVASTSVLLDAIFGTATQNDLAGTFEYSFDGNNWITLNGSIVDVPAGKSSFQLRTNTALDGLTEGNETFNLTATANGASATGIATILDSDVKKITAKLVGTEKLEEGGDRGKYTVQLDQASNQDRFFTIQINDGSAKRFDSEGNGQDFVWGGAYDIASTGQVFVGRVPNSKVNGFDNRAAVGPAKGDASWDFGVYQPQCQQNKGNTVTVKVAAGQTTSEEFSIQAWKENVTVDQDYFNPNGLNVKNYNEGKENFSLQILNSNGVEVTQGNLDVQIKDKTNYNVTSPIAIDLNGDGIQTVSADAGVTFDILNSGQQTNIGWFSGNDGFLAVDSNSNGVIDDRSELFGGGVGEGFGTLETFDSNKDGVVNSADGLFGNLQIWQDANVDGKTDAGELVSLNAANIDALNVAYTNQFATDRQGNVLGERSTAIDSTGKSLEMIDVYFDAR